MALEYKYPELRKPGKMRCFDCGYRIEKNVWAPSESAIMPCPVCQDKDLPGLMLVVEFDGQPCGSGFFEGLGKGPGEEYEPDSYIPQKD